MTARWRSPRDWAISLRLGPWVSCLLIRAGVATLRRRDVGREHPDGCWAKGERVIFACWHGRLLTMPLVKEG